MKFKFGFPSEPDSVLDGARRLALPIKKTYIVATAIGFFIILPLFYGMWRMRWRNDVIFGVFKADTIWLCRIKLFSSTNSVDFIDFFPLEIA